jgi:hypothetical protein
MTAESITRKAQSYSDTVIKQFHPIVAQFGFTKPEWDYDEETEVVRVQFENPAKKNAVQIDYHLQDDSYSANYCRMEGDWQMCIEGKLKSLMSLRATLSRWVLNHCEECRAKSESREFEQEEDQLYGGKRSHRPTG